MEVSIRVTRNMPDGSVAVFEGKASSIEGAIAAADQLANGKAEAKTGEQTTKSEDKPKAETKKADAKKAAADPAPANTAKEEIKKDDAPEVTYDQVKKAIIGLASTKGKEIAVAMLQRFGAKSGTDLKAEQWPEVLEMAAKIEAGFDPRDAEAAEEALV